MNYLTRVAPAIALLVVSPVIAEFLLGDFNVRQLAYLAIFIPLYGASALTIRELARRYHRGWPTIILLAMCFGLIAEGFVNQTLFNPHYAGQSLLAYGYIAELGTSLNYAVYIVVLHTVWSISAPVALAEALAGERSRQAWLSPVELSIVGVLSLLGLIATGVSTYERFHFSASLTQYAVVLVLILLLVSIAFSRFSALSAGNPIELKANAKTLMLLGVISLCLSSAFQFWFHYAPHANLNSWVGLAGFVTIVALTLGLILKGSGKESGPAFGLALATGAILTYVWFGFQRLIGSGHTALGVPTTQIDLWGQGILVVVVLLLCWLGFKRAYYR